MTATKPSSGATSPTSTRTSSITDDASPPSADCPICLGQGFVVRDLPVSHPDFGKAVPCICRAGEITARKQAAIVHASNLNQLGHMTFDTFLPDGAGLPEDLRQNLRRAFQKARDFASHPEGWLLLTGAYGSGKTHLAAAIAHDVMSRGEPVLFVVVPDLLDYLRATFGPSSETSFDDRFEAVRQSPLLILDDFGSQSATPWAKEKLFQILNFRYVAHLPTVLTTNLRLNEIEPRLRSRLADPDITTSVPIIAPDFRSGGQAFSHELSTLSLHADQTFASFNLRRGELEKESLDNLAKAKTVAEEYAADPKGWLVFTGRYGSGKTHLAAAVANEYQKLQHERPMFVVVPDLLDYLRAAFGPNTINSMDMRFDEVRHSPMLILDDLGTESATPWAREKLFQLLNYRYAARLPTVITTSDDIKDIDERLASRMLDTSRCHIFSIVVPSYRGGAAQRQQKRAGRN